MRAKIAFAREEIRGAGDGEEKSYFARVLYYH